MKHVLMILSILLLIGCDTDTELRIYNDTPIMQQARVNGYTHQIAPGGEPVVEKFILNHYLFFGETAEVVVEYLPNSPISFRSYKKMNLKIKPNQERKLHINFDRGQLQLRNLAPVALDQVLLQEIGKTSWTEDLYEGILEPENIDIIAHQAGSYNLKFIDAYGIEYPVSQIEIVAGEQLMIIFDGSL